MPTEAEIKAAVAERDREAYKHLEAAGQAISDALRAMPNSVHSTFGEFDVRELSNMQRQLHVLMLDRPTEVTSGA